MSESPSGVPVSAVEAMYRVRSSFASIFSASLQLLLTV